MRTLIIIPVLLFSLFLGASSYSADFYKGLTAAQSGDFATALKEWKPLAEEGNAVAQNNLGLMYHNGWGVPQDYKEAVYWYRLAVEQGYAIAQYNLGLMYEKGKGVPQDDKEAAQLYRLAAEQGDVDAQYNLDFIHRKGLGVPQDDKEAVWFDNKFTINLVISGLFAMLGGSYMVYRYNFKDISSLPEIKLLINEEIIFSNYKIVAFDEGHTIWNQKLAFYYCTLTNKAFYILLHSKYKPKVGLSGRMKSNTQIFDEMVWKRISYEQSEIKFGKIFPYRYVELIHKKEKFSVRVQLTALFNKQARQIGNYIKDELKHLVIKS